MLTVVNLSAIFLLCFCLCFPFFSYQSSIPVFRPVACLPGNVTLSFAVEKVPAGILACTKYVFSIQWYTVLGAILCSAILY